MKTKNKVLTVGGSLAFIALVATAWAGGKYLLSEAKENIVKPPLVKLICHVHDSVSIKDRRMLLDANMQSRKTQSYMEVWMANPELVDAAKRKWHDDSVAYAQGLIDGH
jgi:hypothetical protein